MNLKSFIILSMILMMSAGCARFKSDKKLKVDTEQHSPIRMHVYHWDAENKSDIAVKRRVLILPPFGFEDTQLRNDFHQKLYSAAQRRFQSPIQVVRSDSEYAPYINKENLMKSDGTLNYAEVAFIGALMNCTHVLCPYVRELNPYHPQRIDIKLMLIDAGTGKNCAEFSGILDARDSITVDYFLEFTKHHKDDDEKKDDQQYKMKSPSTFQAFAADLVSTVISDNLDL